MAIVDNTTRHRDGTVSITLSAVEWEQIREGLSAAYNRERIHCEAIGIPLSERGHMYANYAAQLLDALYPIR